MMANIREWLEEAEHLHGETIEAIVVGPMDGWRQGEVQPNEDVVLSRDAGLQMVDHEHNDGYGSADCPPIYAWTASRVFMIDEYDGSTQLGWVPRNPIACTPSFGGNGY